MVKTSICSDQVRHVVDSGKFTIFSVYAEVLPSYCISLVSGGVDSSASPHGKKRNLDPRGNRRLRNICKVKLEKVYK